MPTMASMEPPRVLTTAAAAESDGSGVLPLMMRVTVDSGTPDCSAIWFSVKPLSSLSFLSSSDNKIITPNAKKIIFDALLVIKNAKNSFLGMVTHLKKW